MELTKQVTSLELAKRLKMLGVKQESYFLYQQTYLPEKYHPDGTWELVPKVQYESQLETLAAFTVAELGEMLLDFSAKQNDLGFRMFWDSYGKIVCGWDSHIDFSADTEADGRGKMLAYLIENNLLHV